MVLTLTPIQQQRCPAAVQPARVVAVDVALVAIHLPHRVAPRPSPRADAHRVQRCRARHSPAAFGPDMLGVHGTVHLFRRRVYHEPERDERLPVLHVQHDGRLPEHELQHLLLAPLAQPGHLRGVHLLQCEFFSVAVSL